jgi:hypothetical protein
MMHFSNQLLVPGHRSIFSLHPSHLTRNSGFPTLRKECEGWGTRVFGVRSEKKPQVPPLGLQFEDERVVELLQVCVSLARHSASGRGMKACCQG